VDLQLSAEVARALQNYAKPWYRLRAVRVFRDVSVLAANSDAWGAVEHGLAESEFLILLASPEAAASPWVRREVQYWLAHRSRETVLLALTGGDIVWDPGAGDFDWARTTALPAEVLRGAFPQEPNYVDLRAVRRLPDRARRRALRTAIADLAAPLHHRSKDDIVGEEYRVLRRNRRLALTVTAALVALTVAAVVFGVQSSSARAAAELRRRVALSGQLAAESERVGDTDPDRARLLAAIGWRLDQNTETEQALAGGSLLAARHVLRGHDGIVWAMAFSPDGRRLATASNDATVRVWNTTTGAAVGTLAGHTGAVRLVAFSPDGSLLATSGDDRTIRVWDAASGRLTTTVTVADVPQAIRFNRDREISIASVPSDVDSAVISDWDATTGAPLGSTSTDSLIAFRMAFSPDGGMLAADVGDSVELFDSYSGEPAGVIDGRFGLINAMALNPDHTLLAVGLSDGTVSVWNTGTRTRIESLDTHAASVQSVAFSADGRTLAAGTADSVVRIWDAATGRAIPTTASGQGGPVVALAFSPDGRTLATTGQGSAAWLWNAPGPPMTVLSGDTAPVFGVAFSPNGSTMATASEDGTARLWSTATGTQTAMLRGTGPTYAAAFSPNGASVLTLDGGGVRLWREATGSVTATIGAALVFAISPDGQVLATADLGNAVRLWNAVTGAPLRTLSGHSGSVRDIAFSPDSATVAAASDDHTTRLWSTATGAAIATLTGHTGSVTSVLFSPDGKSVATISDDNTTRLWDAATGSARATLGESNAMALSPDGATLATGGMDGTVRLWRASTGALIRTLAGHTGPISSVAYSPDGATLATGGEDRTVRLWSPGTGTAIAILSGHTGAVWSVAFSRDGTMLASAAVGDDMARLWRVSFRTDPYAALCKEIGRPVTAAEWSQYAPGIDAVPVC
jgi:WD40 repeat protein